MMARPITPENAEGPVADRRCELISWVEAPFGMVARTEPGSAAFAAAITSVDGTMGSPMRMKPRMMNETTSVTLNATRRSLKRWPPRTVIAWMIPRIKSRAVATSRGSSAGIRFSM